MKKLVTFALFAFLFATLAVAQDNIAAGGLSYNPGASPAIAGTGLYARSVSDKTGTYAFAVVDALPLTMKPFQVTTQFSAGVAQKVPGLKLGNGSVFIPTSAGVSYSGTNTGWAWTTGALADFPLKTGHVMPNVRLVKSSVSNNAGYQVIIGCMYGWGW